MSRRPPDIDPRRYQGIPRVRWIQKGNTDDGDDAIFLASEYGLVPDDPWQTEIVRGWLTRRKEDCRWTHPRSGIAVPRQNGKNGALEVRELFGLVVLGEAILHTAHQIKTSRKAFKRLKHFFGECENDPDAKFPELNALVSEVRNTNGQEAIVLKDVWLVDGVEVRSKGRPIAPFARSVEHVSTGGFIEFATRTGSGGRGSTYDLLVIDEAQHLSEEDLAAIRPVISSGPLGNSQVIYLGTPPNREKLNALIGEAWVRIRSFAGKAKDLLWIEYGAPDGPMPDLDDETLLYSANPSLEIRHGNGNHGLTREVVQGEREELSPEDYARERLGWWGNPEAKAHRGVIDMGQWRTLTVAGDTVPTRGLIVVDCSPDLEWTSIAVATDGPREGRPLAIVDRREGTKWAPAAVKALVDELSSVLEVALTPSAHHLSAKLTALEIEHKKLSTGDVGAGCTAFQTMVADGDFAHVAQPTLDIAARKAITKFINDVQQWDRRDRRVDISPLVAVSVAVQRWALQVAVKPKTVAAPVRHRKADNAASGTSRNSRRGGGFDPRSSGF